MVARNDRNRPLPYASQPRVGDSATQRAFELLFVPLREVVRLLQPYVQQDPWHDLPLASNASNYGNGYQTAQYRKDPWGRVFVHGTVVLAGAHPGTETIGVLPVGYRPAASHAFAVADAGYVSVDSGGVITHITGGHAHIDLEFSFDTE